MNIVKPTVQTIIIANIAEFYLSTFRHFPEKEQEVWVKSSIAEADMAFFWCGDNKLVIVSESIDELFLRDIIKQLGYKNIYVASPAKPSASLCEDILAEPQLFNYILKTIQCSNNPRIVAWGATPQLYALLNRLRAAGATFHAPEIPAEANYWVVPYIDSKSGFREICASLAASDSKIRLPEGITCSSIEMAADVAVARAKWQRGFVVKCDNGVGGYGVLLYSPDDFIQHTNIHAHILMHARLKPVFSRGLVIVEEYIASQAGSEIASPSIQVVVGTPDDVYVSGLAGQIIGKNGRYLGTAISSSIFPTELAAQLHHVGLTVGYAVGRLGYRGKFNIDTVLGLDGYLYCIELNARRTSVTYVIDIAKHLLGTAYETSVAIITTERFTSRQLAGQSYQSIRSKLASILFPLDGNPEGVIITIASSLANSVMPQLGFIAIGRDTARARTLHSQTCRLLDVSD